MFHYEIIGLVNNTNDITLFGAVYLSKITE